MDIIKLEGERKYWVVRAGSGGSYLDHFYQSNIIAIGHMDSVIVKSSGYVAEDDMQFIENDIRNKENEKDIEERESPAQITKKISTVRAFIAEINVGDIVLTLKDDSVLIGTVTSEPFIQLDEIKSLNKNGELSNRQMNYCLRRKVKWDRVALRSSLPWMLKNSLGSSQSIFRLDHHKALLEHWLYSIFINEDGLHFSTRIDKVDDISQYHITEFQRTIQKLELIADLISKDKIDVTGGSEKFLRDIENAYFEYGMDSKFSLTTKQSFSSPGNIWSYIPFPKFQLDDAISKKKIYALALLIQVVYGSAMATNLDGSMLSEEQIQQVVDVARIIKVEGNFTSHQKNLQAHLEERRKVNVNIQKEDVPKNKKVIFPDINEKGDVGQ
jgi:hypothetical protein